MDILHTTLFITTILYALGYGLLIGSIYNGWERTPEWNLQSGYRPTTKLSVIIAARNEEKSIIQCINSILANSYPPDLLEIIIVDDHSTDNTLSFARSIPSTQLSIIVSSGNGKKAALHDGISNSSGQLIIQTDADCIVDPRWLTSISSYYEQSKARLIAGPIQYAVSRSTVHRFQYLDALNNMAVTAHGILSQQYYMANGANLAYEKSLYVEIGGFEGNEYYASGDDMHLIQRAAVSDPRHIRFLKSRTATVKTKAESSWQALASQRKRWSTKTAEYSDSKIVKIQGYIFLFVLLLFLDLMLSPFGSGLSLFAFLFGLMIKCSVDYMYLSRISEFFPQKEPMKRFIPSSISYLFYIMLAGWWAIFPSKYQWKNRTVR